MKEKILAELRKYKHSHKLTDKLIDTLASKAVGKVEKEEDIEAFIKENLENSFISVAELQTEADRRASEWQQRALTLQAQLEKTQPAPPPAPTNVDEKLEAVLKRLDAFERQGKAVEFNLKFKQSLQQEKIPISLGDGLLITNEQELHDAMNAVRSKYNEIKQEMINEGTVFEAPKKPTGGVTAKEQVIAEIEALSKKF